MRKNTTQLFEDIKKHLKQAKNKMKNYEKSDSQCKLQYNPNDHTTARRGIIFVIIRYYSPCNTNVSKSTIASEQLVSKIVNKSILKINQCCTSCMATVMKLHKLQQLHGKR